MQTNDKSFAFLLLHKKNRSNIYIRRVEVSTRSLRNLSLGAGVFCLVSFISLGVFAVSRYKDASVSNASVQSQSQLTAQISTGAPVIDYSRPGSFDDISLNSGGPYDPNETETEDDEMERLLKVIQTTSDPASLPTIWAHAGKINNEFGFRRNPFGGRTYEFHAGMDIDGERGDQVVAPASGVVTEAGWKGGYGQMIEIDHGNGLKTRYGHLSKIEISAGDVLTRGQLIGNVGSTGRSTGPHLHYELRLNDRPINPRRFLPPEPMELKKIQS